MGMGMGMGMGLDEGEGKGYKGYERGKGELKRGMRILSRVW